jgi:hypothetical protein
MDVNFNKLGSHVSTQIIVVPSGYVPKNSIAQRIGAGDDKDRLRAAPGHHAPQGRRRGGGFGSEMTRLSGAGA